MSFIISVHKFINIFLLTLSQAIVLRESPTNILIEDTHRNARGRSIPHSLQNKMSSDAIFGITAVVNIFVIVYLVYILMFFSDTA